MMDYEITQTQRQALERLIKVAQSGTGQSEHAAAFLLAWWNAGDCGGFDITAAWAVDTAIAADMIEVFSLAVARNAYPDEYGYGPDFQRIVAIHRPTLQQGQA